MAAAALALGVLSFLGGVTAIPAIVCGIAGWRAARKFGGEGRAVAATGIVLSFGSLVLVWLAVVAAERAQEAATWSNTAGNFCQLSIAVHDYNNIHDHLPAPFARNPGPPFLPATESELAGKLSWRVSILPFIEQHEIHRQMNLNEPWDSPANRPFAFVPIPNLRDVDTRDDPNTRRRVFHGPDTVFPLDKPMTLAHITDGGSCTLLMIESGEKVTWTRFAEIKFDPSNPPDPTTMGRPGSRVFVTAMADGSTRTFRKTMDPQVLKATITPNGGEVVHLDD